MKRMKLVIGTFILCFAFLLSAADAPYACKVGDKVEGWNTSWYKATIVEIGSGNYAGYCRLKWDEYSTDTWISAKNIRARQDAPAASGGAASANPPTAKYTCGVFLSGRFTFTQSVTLKPDGTYQTSTGSSGRYQFDAATKNINFTGGALESS